MAQEFGLAVEQLHLMTASFEVEALETDRRAAMCCWQADLDSTAALESGWRPDADQQGARRR